jgi:SAM-dependent methyltransferase
VLVAGTLRTELQHPAARGKPSSSDLAVWQRDPRRAGVELFLVSFLILFFELACIRWFGATVTFLSFFTNIVLMASFLGVSVGCLAARRRGDLINGLGLLTFLAVNLAYATLWSYVRFTNLVVEVGSQQAPQFVYFGTDSRTSDVSKFVIPIEIIAGFFFVLIALLFVGLGQVMGRRFAAISNRVAAYTADILGSLTGILAFATASYLQLPSFCWFALSLGLSLYFVTRSRWRWLHGLAACGALFTIAMIDWPPVHQGMRIEHFWSPYYLVSYKWPQGWIAANNIHHQGMLPVRTGGSAYALPYLLNRDAGGKQFEDVLIIGAGSGNDVAAALWQQARHVDAVEIDPVIAALGRRGHPDRPFQDSRVSVHLDDGRSFVRRTEKKYDLIIYALVDSLVLHSGYSSIRLESFLFTDQAFRDVKAKLKPGGVFALYNFYRQGWVIGRLQALARTVFGSTPIVVSLPYKETISPEENQRGYITCLMVGDGESSAVERIRSRMQQSQFFWLSPQPGFNESVNGYGVEPPPLTEIKHPPFNRIGLARVTGPEAGPLPSDDWPFLYLRDAAIPDLNLRGMAIVGVLSLLLLLLFAPVRRLRPNGQMLFLGAGFMLLETKGVVHMALLFGSTWMVNSIVFFVILCMILASNLYVMTVRPRDLRWYYVLLILTLGLNCFVPMADYLALPGMLKVLASCFVVFVPVFFAGVIFATSFRDSNQPDIDFGSNIAGVILGGLSEFCSLAVGFNHLLGIAIGFYLLSALLRPRGGGSGGLGRGGGR